MSDILEALRKAREFDEKWAQSKRDDILELNVDHPISITLMREQHAKDQALFDAMIDFVAGAQQLRGVWCDPNCECHLCAGIANLQRVLEESESFSKDRNNAVKSN